MSEMFPALVTLLATGFYFYTSLSVGQARGRYKIEAPAMTGNPDFERVVRVQMNTLEWLPLFLPALWLFSFYVDPVIGSAIGLVWIVGRIMFAQGYKIAANKRSTGFLVQFIAWAVLFLGALIGIIWKLAGMAPLLTQPLI